MYASFAKSFCFISVAFIVPSSCVRPAPFSTAEATFVQQTTSHRGTVLAQSDSSQPTASEKPNCTYWQPRAPELCDTTLSKALPTVTNPAPGRTSKRIAILFWKMSFRGANGFVGLANALNALNPDHVPPSNWMGKEFWMCKEPAEQIQRAISGSHVANIIEPLEQAGRTVDVYVSSPRCASFGADPEYSKFLEGELVKYYSSPSRIVEAEFFDPPRGGSQEYSEMKGAKFLMESLRTSGRVYESIIAWRFDIVNFNKIVDANFSSQETVAIRQESTCAPPPRPGGYPDNFLSGAYLAYATNTILHVEDHSLSFPGWTIPCIFSIYAEGGTVPCGSEGGFNKLACRLQANFDIVYDIVRESKDKQSILDCVWPAAPFFIYRGPLGHSFQVYGGPVNDCRYLEQNFGGPSCNFRDIAKLICKTWCSNHSQKAACMSEVWPAFKQVALNDADQKQWSASVNPSPRPQNFPLDFNAPSLPDKDEFASLC